MVVSRLKGWVKFFFFVLFVFSTFENEGREVSSFQQNVDFYSDSLHPLLELIMVSKRVYKVKCIFFYYFTEIVFKKGYKALISKFLTYRLYK